MKLVLALAAALLLAGVAGSASRGAETGATATLKLTKWLPLTLRGTNFRPSERVTLTVSSRLKRTRTVTADASGTFVATFRDAYNRCTGLHALAAGANGSRATLKVPLRPTLPLGRCRAP